MKILIIDDEHDVANALANVLRRSGHQVWTAYTGSSGIASAIKHRPSVALIDLSMPDMDGYEVASALRPWNRWSLAVMLTSGILLFLSEAMKCYGNTCFRIKMLFLFFALLFQFAFYNRIVKNEGTSAPVGGKIAAAVALCLWFGVGLAGRAIGFLG